MAIALETRVVRPQAYCNAPENQATPEQWEAFDRAIETVCRFDEIKEVRTVDPEAWVQRCLPRRRKVLEPALAAIRESPIVKKDSVIQPFVKTECNMPKMHQGLRAPDEAAKPRVISARTPNFTVATAPAFREIGKLLASTCRPFVSEGVPNHRVYASGVSLEELNDWVHAAISDLRARARGRVVVVLMKDASTWDGHNSEKLAKRASSEPSEGQRRDGYWMRYLAFLKWKHHRDKANFVTGLRLIPKNKGRTKDGALRYEFGDGARKSGDGNTSVGNSADNLAIDEVGKEEAKIEEEDCYGAVLGDDSLTIMY
jgi:hypothetical protein